MLMVIIYARYATTTFMLRFDAAIFAVFARLLPLFRHSQPLLLFIRADIAAMLLRYAYAAIDMLIRYLRHIHASAYGADAFLSAMMPCRHAMICKE